MPPEIESEIIDSLSLGMVFSVIHTHPIRTNPIDSSFTLIRPSAGDIHEFISNPFAKFSIIAARSYDSGEVLGYLFLKKQIL